MINQFEVPAFIEDALPELRRPLHQFPAIFHLYETVGCLSQYLLAQLRNNNFAQLEKCLRLAGKLYERGNPKVKNAVATILVPPLSAAPLPDNKSCLRLYALIPASLFGIYMHLHLSSPNA